MSAPLTIAVFTDSPDLRSLLSQFLDANRYTLRYFTNHSKSLAQIKTIERDIDCLIVDAHAQLVAEIDLSDERLALLPMVTILSAATGQDRAIEVGGDSHQPAEVVLRQSQLAEIGTAIEQSIAKFLRIKPLASTAADSSQQPVDAHKPSFLLQQQRRLADKLKERLGYLAVYYKRDPQRFFRRLNPAQQQELIDGLKLQYRQIVLDYFANSDRIDAQIDELVDTAFFADISVSEIVKIHMELMEEFSNQLKLEGRSEEVLLDYRLTLIDTIAHLCEMYRRSIPREN